MTLEEKDRFIDEHLIKYQPDTLRFIVADLSAALSHCPTWVQVDILPTPGQIVLFFEPGVREPVWFGYYKDDKWWTINDEEVYGVTHWMARPEPPKQPESV